jgi:hypothetical protein
MTIDLTDILGASPDARERYAKWLGITCKRREGENDGAYRWRLAYKCLRALEKGTKSTAKEQ